MTVHSRLRWTEGKLYLRLCPPGGSRVVELKVKDWDELEQVMNAAEQGPGFYNWLEAELKGGTPLHGEVGSLIVPETKTVEELVQAWLDKGNEIKRPKARVPAEGLTLELLGLYLPQEPKSLQIFPEVKEVASLENDETQEELEVQVA